MIRPSDVSGRTALRFALRWRTHELGNALRFLRSRPLHDRGAVLVGLPLLGCYGIACLVTGLERDRADLSAHPLRSVLLLAAIDLFLIGVPTRLHARRLATRCHRSWVRVLPLDATALRRIVIVDRLLLLGPAMVAVLLLEAWLAWWSGLGRDLPFALPAAISGCFAGFAAGALPVSNPDDAYRAAPAAVRPSRSQSRQDSTASGPAICRAGRRLRASAAGRCCCCSRC